MLKPLKSAKTDRQTDRRTWRLLDQLGPECQVGESQEKNMVIKEKKSRIQEILNNKIKKEKKLNRKTMKKPTIMRMGLQLSWF